MKVGGFNVRELRGEREAISCIVFVFEYMGNLTDQLALA